MGDVTQLLERTHQGDVSARNELFELVYGELNVVLARQKLAGQPMLGNVNAASLVHDAYLRLVRQSGIPGGNRRMFFAYASNVMRSVIVDFVRERRAGKRGRAEMHVALTGAEPEVSALSPDVEALDAALTTLAQVDARAQQIVEMRYFGGRSIGDIAEALNISSATVKRDWRKARAFLHKALQPAEPT